MKKVRCTPRRGGALLRGLAPALTTLLALPAAAQSLAQATLPEVLVTASRVAQPITEVIADVSLIDRSQLAQAGGASLRDVLAQQPGVQFADSGGYRSVTGVYLRGANTSQAIVLIDGVRVGSATAGGAAFENLPLERIERIEILRGAASALYGPDAVGGVIQIFTRDPVDGLQLAAHAGLGSDGQRQAGASVRGGAGALGYSLGVSKEKASGISVINNPASGSFNPDQDGFEVASVDAKFTARLSRQHGLSLGLLRSQMDYQFDGGMYPTSGLDSDAWARPVLSAVNLKWDAQWHAAWKSTLTLARNDDKSVTDYYQSSTGALYSSGRFNTRRTQATWQNDVALGPDVLTLLLEHRAETVDSSTDYTEKQRDVNSVMASYALNRPSWNALAVLRRDDNTQFGGFDNWALSGGYKLAAHWRAVASFGTSFQAPNFNQLYYPDYGTPTLAPQKNRASEIGLKYLQGTLSGSAVLYHNKILGFIDPVTNAQSSLAVLRGLSLSVQNQVGDTRYALSYDYTDPYAEPSQTRLLRIAKNVLNLNISQRLGAVRVFGELKLSSNREDNNLSFTGRDVLAGYGLLNVGVDWKVSKSLSLLARVNNLSDSNYVLASGYAMPGRNLFVSLAWAQ